MEITINATAHYSNGHTETFSRHTDVSEDEYELIRNCALANDKEIDLLEKQSIELYQNLYTLFEHEAKERGLHSGTYRPVRILGTPGAVYRRHQTSLMSITLYYEDEIEE